MDETLGNLKYKWKNCPFDYLNVKIYKVYKFNGICLGFSIGKWYYLSSVWIWGLNIDKESK